MSQSPYGPPNPDEPDRPYSGQPYSGQPPPRGQQPPPYGQGSTYGQGQYGQGPDYGQQPSSGQPNYRPGQYGQQPQYGQGHYGQGQYGQGEYGQPDPTSGQPVYGAPYGQPGSPGGYPPGEPPKKKSRAVPIILISLAVLLVLCLGGGALFYYVNKDEIKQAVDTAASGGPTASSPDDAPSTKAAAKITLVEPKTLNGRPKLTDKQFAGLADEMQKDMGDVPGSTATVGALYGSVEKRNIVMVAGVAAPMDDPKRELDQTFAGAGVGGLKVTGIVDVDPGTLGGKAKCGKADDKDINMAVCAWADEGSLGMVMFFFKSVSSAKAEFPKVRSLIEKKSS